MNKTIRSLLSISAAFFSVLVALCLSMVTPSTAHADEQLFYLGQTVNAGTDTGFSESSVIQEDDSHFGWTLGSFYVSGYTSVQRERNGNTTFLKKNGDTVALHFKLNQDIDCLNGNENLSISNDTDGYDEEYGIAKSDLGFGRGTLIVRQIDYKNEKGTPQIYNDYLSGIKAGADTEVQIFEEGDYEVALDYETKNDVRNLFGALSILPEYRNYTIRFKFSVRNGNTMAFLLDAKTGEELTNQASTENGFTIDFAKSRYLDINVKRETLSKNGDKLVEDIRANGPAKDGEQYTKPGVYTITVTNPSTEQTTEKVIYVGDDPTLVAYATTGYTLREIKSMVAQGATIDSKGTISWPGELSPSSQDSSVSEDASPSILPMAISLCGMAIVAGVAYAYYKNRNQSGKQNIPSPPDPKDGDEE